VQAEYDNYTNGIMPSGPGARDLAAVFASAWYSAFPTAVLGILPLTCAFSSRTCPRRWRTGRVPQRMPARRLGCGGQLKMRGPGQEIPYAPGNRCHEPVVRWGADIGRRASQRCLARILPVTRPGQEAADPAADLGDRHASGFRALFLAG
jgi:hypothetical protein